MGPALRSSTVLMAAFIALIAPASSALPGAVADRKSQAPRKVQLFNIPAQPLSSALQTYSAVSGNQVICDSRLARGRRSSVVVGLFTAETALRMLLDGTELTIRYTGPRDITLALAGSSDTVAGDPAFTGAPGDVGTRRPAPSR